MLSRWNPDLASHQFILLYQPHGLWDVTFDIFSTLMCGSRSRDLKLSDMGHNTASAFVWPKHPFTWIHRITILMYILYLSGTKYCSLGLSAGIQTWKYSLDSYEPIFVSNYKLYGMPWIMKTNLFLAFILKKGLVNSTKKGKKKNKKHQSKTKKKKTTTVKKQH